MRFEMIYKRGRVAGKNGLSHKACPFAPGTAEAHEWLSGRSDYLLADSIGKFGVLRLLGYRRSLLGLADLIRDAREGKIARRNNHE